MKCPICDNYIDASHRCCVKCGSFLKGKRKKDLDPEGRIDVNKDSLEELARAPGLSREDAVFIVKERRERGGFINITEVANFTRKSYEETVELEKYLVCTPIKRNAPAAPKKVEEPEQDEIPVEWGGYAHKIESRKSIEEKNGNGGQAQESGTVDINSAQEEQIAALPGIGIVIAKRITGERAARGGFRSLDELAEFLKLKKYVVDRIAPLVEFNSCGTGAEAKPRGRVVDF